MRRLTLAAPCDTRAMTTPGRQRRHLPSSPFGAEPEPFIEVYELGDRVSHDVYGLGRVVVLEAGAVAVDFGSETVRIGSPFPRMNKL